MIENRRKIGFYPVVDCSEWVAKLAPLNVPSIQLRIKNKNMSFVESEIIKSIHIARQHNCQLFINDYWQLAIQHQAFGLHLGQEDLTSANIKQIHAANIHLGISTHNEAEINRVLEYQPYYIAYGPIYETTSKIMHYTPRGLERLTYWVNTIHLPIVAIGGINLNNVDTVLQTGVDGIAMISAITHATDYKFAVNQFRAATHNCHATRGDD